MFAEPGGPRLIQANSKWCPQCGAEYRPQVTTCADCGAALVDDPPTDLSTHDVVAFDVATWPKPKQRLLGYQLQGRKISWGWANGAIEVAADKAQIVRELIDDIESGHREVPDVPDAFILPDGRVVKELPLGPEVPREPTPIDWVEDRSMRVRWFVAAVRDLLRRLRH